MDLIIQCFYSSGETRALKQLWRNLFVMRPFCLVEPCSQDAAANAGVLSVYLTTILFYNRQLLIDIEREIIPCVNSLCFIVRSTCYD